VISGQKANKQLYSRESSVRLYIVRWCVKVYECKTKKCSSL